MCLVRRFLALCVFESPPPTFCCTCVTRPRHLRDCAVVHAEVQRPATAADRTVPPGHMMPEMTRGFSQCVRHFAACWAVSHDAVIWAFKVVGLGFYPD